ncbi:MAG TPA: GMC family oxidoreductase, partial [Bacteroidota bacterium]|nr:GMC family oxidoreductase [Bacteroidota bacterium]
QKLLTLPLKKPAAAQLDELKSLFQGTVVWRGAFEPTRDFGFFLMRFIFFAYGVYFTYMIVGLVVGARDLPIVSMSFINPPETINTVMKLTLMISLSAVGAFNSGIRREAAVFLLIGHLISVVGSLAMYFQFPVNPLFPMDQSFLLASVAGDGLLAIALVYVVVGPGPVASPLDRVEDVDLRSPASTLMRWYFLLFGSLFTAFTVAIVYFRFAGNPEDGLGAVFGGPDPLVSNSLTKYGTLAALGWYLFKREDMRRFFIPVLTLGFSFSIVATVVYGLQGSTVLISRLGTEVTIPWFMMNHIIVDGGGLALMLALRRVQYHVDDHITALRPGSAECCMALHEAVRDERQAPGESSREVLTRMDQYIVSMRGRRRGLVSFPFWIIEFVFPLVSGFRPPFSTMSREDQRWYLRRYILRPFYEREHALVPPVADIMSQVGDIAHGLVTIAYFTTDRAHDQIGYAPPDARTRLQGDIAEERPPDHAETLPFPAGPKDSRGRKPSSPPKAAATLLAPRVGVEGSGASIPREVDYCIIGSGAAGGVLAHRLSLSRGKQNSICVLERGGYYSPRRDFSDDEMRMIGMLYAEGGLQVSRSFDFTVLQGECVGGTTVINNAVCFRMPPVTKSEWERFGINAAALDPHYDAVAADIHIRPVTGESVNVRAEALFSKGVREYNASLGSTAGLSPVKKNSGNFQNCLGCGQCNIGCRYMRKMSVLETYLPWAQAHGVQVIPELSAVQCETEMRGRKKRATAVIVQTAGGDLRRIRVRKALIVSAGAIASSRFLIRSGVGGAGAGSLISCNFAVPPLVEFDEPLNAFDGLQMALNAVPKLHEAVYETTFNLPGSYAIAAPLHFGEHADMMDAYARSVNFTALVGSDPGGSVSAKADILFGRAIEWDQTADDLLRIKKALATIIRIAAGAGARNVLLPTIPPLRIPIDAHVEERIRDIDRLLTDKRYFNFITAHPQGGNLMADDSFDERVVDLDFRVRDCDNLFVCDASVFPRGVRVNPQWTIMALASAAAEKIAALT